MLAINLPMYKIPWHVPKGHPTPHVPAQPCSLLPYLQKLFNRNNLYALQLKNR